MLRSPRAVSPRSRQVRAFLPQPAGREQGGNPTCAQSAVSGKFSVTKFAATFPDADPPRSCALRERPDKAAERLSCVASEGWARGDLTRLPRRVSSWSAPALAWTGPSSRVASSVSHHLPSLGRLLLFGWSSRPSSSWSPLFGGRQSAALPDWSFCGAQRLGKAATLVSSRWSLCPQVHAGHVP